MNIRRLPMMAIHARRLARYRRPAFSLVELVMVVVIIGVIASIAVPRMTKASQRAELSSIQGNIRTIRMAIDRYYAEHGTFPGGDPANGSPNGGLFIKQLIYYSDSKGEPSQKFTSRFRFGPYMRSPFPKNPDNGLSKVHVKKEPGNADPAFKDAGWVAVLSTGDFYIHLPKAEVDRIEEQLSESARARLRSIVTSTLEK